MMMQDRSRPKTLVKRRPYVGPPKWPMYFASVCATDIPDEGSPTRFAQWNKIVQVPIGDAEKLDTVTTWVTTGSYSTGCPSSWKQYPDRVHFLSEYSSEDQTYPPFNLEKMAQRRRESPHEYDDQDSTEPPEVEYDWRVEPVQRVPKSLIDFYRDVHDYRSGLMLPAPEEGAQAMKEEIDGNNSNNMDLSQYIEDTEVIVYEPYVMYLYPVIPIAPDNNDPYLFEPEARPFNLNNECY
uniref:Expressed conserved protein n=1 Tax=Caenorhabditis tropicalis TaxID=1561998 RepID=A0A1I7SYU1_9PELO